uniref:Gag-pol polyprotein n=1 Tax=Solanum tuberosum TaxID=4113 RepID=M1D928_SOLTU
MKRSRSDEQSQPRSKKRLSNQDFPILNHDRVSNPNSRGNESGSSFERSRCAKCGKKHLGKCLAGMDGCFGCGRKCYKMNDFTTLSAKGRDDKQSSLDGPDPNAPRKNCFYVLQPNKEKGAHPDEGTSM